MRQASGARLPAWVIAAVDSFRPEATWKKDFFEETQKACDQIAERLKRRWHELAVDFVPELATLKAEEKTLVLRHALEPALFGTRSTPTNARIARRDVEKINRQADSALTELITLLERRDSLIYSSPCGTPAPLAHQLIQAAIVDAAPAAAPQAGAALAAFVDGLHRHSVHAPSIADVLRALQKHIVTTGSMWYLTAYPLPGRKGGATDFARIITAALGRVRDHVPDLGEFRFSDKAIATLANVAFDLPSDSGVSPDAIKMTRQRSNDSTRKQF